MTRTEIERMYIDVLGYVVCPHSVDLPTTYCNVCGESLKKDLAELAFAAKLYGGDNG